MARIELKNVTKTGGKKEILKDIDLTFEDQKFTCVLGPPGAGKTTLLRIIAGVEFIDSGSIYIDGEEVTELPPKERNIAMVFQTFALYPHMRVRENIATPLKIMKTPKQEIDKKINDVASFLGISALLERYPRELSGGEQQRVAIARGMVRGARAYLFDEPLTNLDYKIREGMRAELKRMAMTQGSTIIYGTPDPVDVLSMAEKVAVLREGKVEQYGETYEVYDNPVSAYVGRFFGMPSMNLIDCKIEKKDGRTLLAAPPITVDITDLKCKPYHEDKTLLMGIKPHHLYVGGAPVEGQVSFQGEIRLTEVTGAETLVHLIVGSYELIAYVPVIYREEVGTKLWASFKPEDLYLFDKETGLSLKLKED